MSGGRRTVERRRRVLYWTQNAGPESSTAASRRAVEQLREARRPPAAYGSRVHRRLRGRWFSLVPVKRRSLAMLATVISSITLMLCLAHYASVAWPVIANQTQIARPLRLDHPDSFGRWVECMLLAASAGASLMIYQLRRYRIDDYTGQYRLWRLVLVVLVLASINSLSRGIDWIGAIIDAGLGKRVALAGNDWFRLVVSIAGAVLGLRLLAEVRRSHWSLVTMITAWFFLAIPVAAHWKFFSIDSLWSWTLVTCSPLLACSSLLISLSGYLRMLIRQVRNLDEHDSLSERFQHWKLRLLHQGDEEAIDPDPHEAKAESTAKPSRTLRHWFGLRKAKLQPAIETAERPRSERTAERNQVAENSRAEIAEAAADEDEDELDTGSTSKTRSGSSDSAPEVETPKRRGFSLGFFRRNKTDHSQTSVVDSPSPTATKPAMTKSTSPATRPSPAAEFDEEEEEEDGEQEQGENINWDSMSKTERRRMRKQLKRGGRAA